AVAESYFKTLKSECIYQNKFANKEQAALVVFEYIEAWYNRKRLHSAWAICHQKNMGKH
ncbi:MAG: IS3 family transposase, partial [Phormidesmis sp. FL-bin-119]|nr:IS3 family transposase [Pedobacter sp.]